MFAWKRRQSPVIKVEPRIEPRVLPRLALPEPRAAGISGRALGRAQTPPGDGPVSPFIPIPPMAGTQPKSVPTMAQDLNLTQAYEFSANNRFGEGLTFMGYPYLAELAQRPEYRKISETLAKEMTRKWIRLHSAGDEDKTYKIGIIDDCLKKLKAQEAFRRATEHDGFFGRGQIYIDTGKTMDPEELKTPLLLSKAKLGNGALKALSVIEPMWSYPAHYNANNPLGKNFYKPTSWYFQGKEVHVSRMLMFVGREVPDMLKPAYSFGGLAMTQMAKPYVDNWLRVRDSVSDMIESFSTMVLSTNMGASLSGGNGDDIADRATLFNLFRNNRGLFMLDKEQEELSNVSAPLGTLDHLQAQAQEHMSSVSSIPLVKLLGITPSGLNASSDGEIRVFYDWINAQQEHMFTGNLERLIEMIQYSQFGECDPDITFSYVPLWQMTEAEEATMRKTNADTAQVYISGGVLLPEEERTRLAAEDSGLYPGLDLSVVPPPPGGDPSAPPGGEDPQDPNIRPTGGEPPPGPEEDKPEPAGGADQGSALPFTAVDEAILELDLA